MFRLRLVCYPAPRPVVWKQFHKLPGKSFQQQALKENALLGEERMFNGPSNDIFSLRFTIHNIFSFQMSQELTGHSHTVCVCVSHHTNDAEL